MKENNQEKSPLKQKILLYLKNKGVSLYEFYKQSGVTRGVLSQKTGINEDNLARFLAYAIDINPEWLLTGEGEMLKGSERSANIAQECPANPQTDAQNTETGIILHSASKGERGAIPLVAERAIGGLASEHFKIEDSDILAYYVIPKFRYLNVDFMIEAYGDSMVPRICPGDIIACSIINNSQFIQWNKPHLIATREQGLIIKRLRKSDEKNCLLAISDNNLYEPFNIPMNEIAGIARIVGIIHIE